MLYPCIVCVHLKSPPVCVCAAVYVLILTVIQQVVEAIGAAIGAIIVAIIGGIIAGIGAAITGRRVQIPTPQLNNAANRRPQRNTLPTASREWGNCTTRLE